MADYRWNVTDFAEGYDAAAQHIHPYYHELQALLLDLLPLRSSDEFLLVDAGGGSGRWVELFLTRFVRARAMIVDQSEAFLAIARSRLAAFGSRAECRGARLQDSWADDLSEQPAAIVSMSAIHHLDADEKQGLFARCCRVLRPGGVFINADEVRPPGDAEYLSRCRGWVGHMHQVIDAGLVPAAMHENLRKWEERNVVNFGTLRRSGDDCHETIQAQLCYLTAAGFRQADCPWEKEMWAIMRAVK